jgi:dipeptidyl aminopeptidase/acylaminoacyl peptidase
VTSHLDVARSANPIRYIDKSDPPFLIMHGDKDVLVPLEQSRILEQALTVAGVPAKLVVLPGAGHGNGFGGEKNFKQVADFFDEQLKPGKTSRESAH